MKRFISIFSITLFIILSINTSNAFSQPRIFTQGIYNARDSNLLIGGPITARITSSNNSALIIVIDSNQNIQEVVRLGSGSPEHILTPLDYNSSVIIFTTGSVSLS